MINGCTCFSANGIIENVTAGTLPWEVLPLIWDLPSGTSHLGPYSWEVILPTSIDTSQLGPYSLEVFLLTIIYTCQLGVCQPAVKCHYNIHMLCWLV